MDDTRGPVEEPEATEIVRIYYEFDGHPKAMTGEQIAERFIALLETAPNRINMINVTRERRAPPPESVHHPLHYGGDTTYEVIKVIEAWDLGFHLGNTVKYIARIGKKIGAEELEDLRKARWYLDRKIEQQEKS